MYFFCWSDIFGDHRFGIFREVCWLCWSRIITHLVGSQDVSSQSRVPNKMITVTISSKPFTLLGKWIPWSTIHSNWIHFLPKKIWVNGELMLGFFGFPWISSISSPKISTKSRLKGSMETVGFEAGAASRECHGQQTVVGWKKSRSQPPFGCTGDPGTNISPLLKALLSRWFSKLPYDMLVSWRV